MFSCHRQGCRQQLYLGETKSKPADRNVRATMIVTHKYVYRRRLPHYQKADYPIFVTFRKLSREPFPPEARTCVLEHCLYGNGTRFNLHATVIMPEHVHLVVTPLRDAEGWPYELPKLLKLIKGASARNVNRLFNHSGPVWQDESFDHVLRSDGELQEKIEYMRQNPVRRGLVEKPEDYPWLWLGS
jgi:REP element-mobilizing transposase RayT